MARILYGIAQEGMGHAIRAKVLIDELSKKHDILVITGGKPFYYLSKYFKDIIRINDFDLAYRNNKISTTQTFLRNLIRLPLILSSIIRNTKKIKKFNPDIIISDFEPISNYLSYYLDKPLVSVDNQHISTKCKITIPKKFRRHYNLSSLVISAIITNASYYLITSYFFPKIKENNAFIFYPIIRKEILNSKPSKKGHILVYQTSKTNKKLIPALKKTRFNFIFYSDKAGTEKNIVFKKFSEKEFIKDMSSCKAVITNGGFGLISESIYLGKPVLSIPIKKQFEQILNALHVKKLGYGDYSLKIDEVIIDNFMKNIPGFRRNLKRYNKQDNSDIVDKLNKLINKLVK